MEHVIYERPDRLQEFGNDREHFFTTKKVSLKDRICLSPMVKYVIPAFGIIALLMLAVYLTMYFFLVKSDDDWPATCNIRSSYRVECFPGKSGVTYDNCMNVGCCWNDETEFCFHSIPSRHGYTPKNSGAYNARETLIPRRTSSPLGPRNVDSISLDWTNVDANHVEIILKISGTNFRAGTSQEDPTVRQDSTRRRRLPRRAGGSDELSKRLLHFLPDNPERRTVSSRDDAKSNMAVYLHSPEFSVTVTRKGDTTSRSLLSTARGPLILTENFWELTLYITNRTVYGLNQLQLNGTTNLIYNNENGTARPAFLGIDERGLATACYVGYDGPMEIQVLDESNLVVLRGFSLPREISLHVFAGPTPLEAARQLTKALQKATQTAAPPLPSLGLHICPNDDSDEFIESLNSIIKDMATREAPWDSHCLHQGFNPTLGNSLDENQEKIVVEAKELLANNAGDGGRILVPHLTPMLFESNNKLADQLAESSLLLRTSSVPYVGVYRNQSVVYPDWFDNRTFDASLSDLTDYLTKFAASKLLYVRDSWPKDETPDQSKPTNSRFAYLPKGLPSLMSTGTVPYTLLTSSRTKSHYAEHNAYSEKFWAASALQGWTSLVIRGLWGESGQSSWAALRAAVRAGVGSGLVGQLPSPMYICGTGEDLGPGNNNDELCSRWYGAAVAWPHVLVLPANLPGGIHLTASSSTYAVKHLKLRASLLTYTLTKLAEHRAHGSPLLSPTSTHYPTDLRARNRWNQFLWGDSILVGLVTLPGVSQVLMWLPGKYPWRHLHGGLKIDPSISSFTSIAAPEGQIVTLVRPGHIVPLHEKISMTSAATLTNQLTLVINLACDEDCFASGKIFYGESVGEFLLINATATTLQLDNVQGVKKLACGTGVTRQQATLIKYVEILGDIKYPIDTDLCSVASDTIAINFDKTP